MCTRLQALLLVVPGSEAAVGVDAAGEAALGVLRAMGLPAPVIAVQAVQAPAGGAAAAMKERSAARKRAERAVGTQASVGCGIVWKASRGALAGRLQAQVFDGSWVPLQSSSLFFSRCGLLQSSFLYLSCFRCGLLQSSSRSSSLPSSLRPAATLVALLVAPPPRCYLLQSLSLYLSLPPLCGLLQSLSLSSSLPPSLWPAAILVTLLVAPPPLCGLLQSLSLSSSLSSSLCGTRQSSFSSPPSLWLAASLVSLPLPLRPPAGLRCWSVLCTGPHARPGHQRLSHPFTQPLLPKNAQLPDDYRVFDVLGAD
eukprot:361547-Chlamydomonas_euryale.AAC.1